MWSAAGASGEAGQGHRQTPVECAAGNWEAKAKMDTGKRVAVPGHTRGAVDVASSGSLFYVCMSGSQRP